MNKSYKSAGVGVITLINKLAIIPLVAMLFSLVILPVFGQEEPEIYSEVEVPAYSFTDVVTPFYEPTQNALTQLFTSGAESGVNIVGALILILIGYLVGLAIAKAISLFINKLLNNKFLKEKVDIDIQKEKDEGWYHITNLIAPTIKWIVWIYFFVTAIDLLGFTEASEALAVLWIYIPNILAFVVVIAVGTIGIRYVMRWAESRKDIFGEKGEITLQKTLVKAILYTIIFAIGITQLGIGGDIIDIIIWVVLGGIMATIVVSAGWGLREFVPQLVKNKALADLGVKKGVQIKLHNYKSNTDAEYEIIEVGITHTKVKDKDIVRVIPNVAWQGYHFELKEAKSDDKKKED